jgi:hypothetical protein
LQFAANKHTNVSASKATQFFIGTTNQTVEWSGCGGCWQVIYGGKILSSGEVKFLGLPFFHPLPMHLLPIYFRVNFPKTVYGAHVVKFIDDFRIHGNEFDG